MTIGRAMALCCLIQFLAPSEERECEAKYTCIVNIQEARGYTGLSNSLICVTAARAPLSTDG